MSKLIGALLILAAIAGGYLLFTHYKSIEADQRNSKDEPVAEVTQGSELSGLPYNYEESLKNAQEAGPKVFGAWLARYGHVVADPRKAWIELDYVVSLAPQDPVAARKLFKQVKARVPPDSPVYPRVQRLSKTYNSK